MDYLRFSDEEYRRRFNGVREILDARGLDGLLAYGARGRAGAVPYLTNWLPTREASFLWVPGGMSRLIVQLSNHVLAASRMSIIDDVQFGGSSATGGVDSLPRLVDCLKEAGLASGRLGIGGALPHEYRQRLQQELPGAKFVSVTGDLQRLQMVKSDEELALTARAAALSDAAVEALVDQLAPGWSEHEIAALIDWTHGSRGGATTVRHMLTTSMHDADAGVPFQYPRDRRLAAGDVVVVELSAALSGYSGQVLRSLTVASEPTAEFRRMHDVAEEAFEAIADVLTPGCRVTDVMDAAGGIEEAGYGIWDDLLHGANQAPPIVRTWGSQRGFDEQFRFEEGMVVVIQPNVVTPDGLAGVQYGEMVRVTQGGAVSLHEALPGFLRCG